MADDYQILYGIVNIDRAGRREIPAPPTSWARTIRRGRGKSLLPETGRGRVQSVKRTGMPLPLTKGDFCLL